MDVRDESYNQNKLDCLQSSSETQVGSYFQEAGGVL